MHFCDLFQDRQLKFLLLHRFINLKSFILNLADNFLALDLLVDIWKKLAKYSWIINLRVSRRALSNLRGLKIATPIVLI